MARFNHERFLAVSLSILCAGMVAAGQGDDSQSVCDASGLIGAAYASCHVYCDALDCDGQLDPKQVAACQRAYDRFFDLTGNTPPCETACPCAAGWLDAAFVPPDLGSTQCFVELGDNRGLWDLRIEGVPDENGFVPMNAAGFDFFEDGQEGFRRFGCFSERYSDDTFLPSEDSGVFEVTTTFRNEDPELAQQRADMYASCQEVFQGLLDTLGAECDVVDDRTD